MADQTHGAVDSLLSLLTGAVKDEARLLGGVHGDIQFIKDEMDSMNGFLLHLTKTESEHDDQIRAWMKQVRDIAYIAQDCIELYMRDIAPPQEPGLWALLRRIPTFLWMMRSRHRLATKIRELKVRVRDVGERRQRYDVNVRSTEARQKPPAGQGGDDEARRDDFLDALLGPHGDGRHGIVDIDKAIALLPHLQSPSDAAAIHDIVERCGSFTAKEMFLRALCAYPHWTQKDLENLEKKKTEEKDFDAAVMIFCYSKLSTHYKSCLQYLTAFLKEDSISRTSMVRRWLAEGLVAREEGLQSLEEAAEHCFGELMFRGFLRRDKTGAAGKVKSCKMDQEIKDFVVNISKDENFVGGHNLLPHHLQNQVVIRDIVRKQQQAARSTAPPAADTDSDWACGLCTSTGVISSTMTTVAQAEKKQDLLVGEIVGLLKTLQLNPLYRLNVLDLGGCKGLRKRHLKIICKVLWLKYLCLRDTDVSVLPSQINNLRLLETLDVRQTDARAKGSIFLPKLKHLLAGHAYRVAATADESSSLTKVRMPHKIAAMRDMEILSHVQVNDGDADHLDLPQQRIRKLGVLLTGSQPQTITRLLRTVSKLSPSLHSLSIGHASAAAVVNLNMENATAPLPISLESLHINVLLGNDGLPKWFQNLNKLSKVTLCKTALPVASLRTLGKLEALCCLRLRHNSFVEKTLTFNSGEFHSLKFLLMEDITIKCIEFQPSDVPKLERITWWYFSTDDSTATDFTSFSDMVLPGMKDLPSLKLVQFNPGNRRVHNLSINRGHLEDEHSVKID